MGVWRPRRRYGGAAVERGWIGRLRTRKRGGRERGTPLPRLSVFACDDGFVQTSPVGSFKANAYGLNDMLGNVFQWTEDCWQPDYQGAPTDGSARADGNCAERELRGGSWFSNPGYVRSSYRNHFAADYRTSSVGMRLARDLEP